ncbi:unnamed protein product [Oppiella nova]|uniref:Carrier domain-containing protein n=1 Tax=Oppiella nova TaxID=334625 RepID=A0A7R9QRM6_9ACAR|nr:unnamed protein product [Oppiella nova]CAG2172457.1 unnamed protein product [Oppiella nova]
MGIDMGRTFATSLNANIHSMTTVPEHWSMAEAATILSTYGTLYYALIKRANLKRGESILIHSAAGGVGQSCINMCQHYGCDIYVTVGTDDKKQFLMKEYNIPENRIFNSRDVLFKNQIKEATKGRGVDIVLNSLAGEKLDASYECVANSGRFVELGRYDMLQNKKLGMFDFVRNIQFIGIVFDIVAMDDMDFFAEFYDWVHKNSKNGCVKPITYTTFNVNEYDKAFRYMTTGKHMGKVIIKLRDEENTRKPLKMIKSAPNITTTVKTFFDPNKVYIITGGLGGFGMELVPWMLYYGARKFVVTSRSGVKTDYQKWVYNRAKSFYEGFKYFKCDYVVSTANGFTIEGTQQLLKEAQELGPIGGGNGGQSNYSFGNSMCERICEQRRRDGLHGLAIQYGPIGDVGVFAETDQLLTMTSIRKQRINSCCDVLDKLLQSTKPVVTSHIKVDQVKEGGSRKKRMVAELWRALGIDPETTPNHLTLGEIGLESMFAVELQQELEREWNMKVSINQVKSITVGMLKDYEAGNVGELKKHVEDIKRARAYLLKQKFIIPNEVHVRLNNVTQGRPVYFLPTVILNFSLFEELALKLNRPAIGLHWTRDVSKLTSLKDMSNYYVRLLKELEPNGKYDVVGYFDTTITCSKLLLKGMAGKAVVIDVISDHRFCEDELTDEFMVEFMLTILSGEIPDSFKERVAREIKKEKTMKAKIRLICNEVTDFAGKGLVAPDMEEIFNIMIARIRMLSEYRLNKKKKFANKLKLAIGKKWAKKSGKLILIKPIKLDDIDNLEEFMDRSRDIYLLPGSKDKCDNIQMEMIENPFVMDLTAVEIMDKLEESLK